MLLLTAAETRALEAALSARRGLGEAELIARAGAAAAQAAAAMLGGARGRRVAVLCGKGHKAADGLLAARELAAGGASVSAALAFPESELKPLAAQALAAARAAGVRIFPAAEVGAALEGAELALDALLGTGARLPLAGSLAALVEALAAAAPGRGVLALDLPSGLDPDSGEAGAACVRATATLSFLAPKLGLFLGRGPELRGELRLAPLGAEAAWAEPQAQAFDAAWAARALSPRPGDYHKKKAELLVVAGSAAYLGAALLCARAAYRCGAGLVRLALPEALAPQAQAALPEAVVAGLPAESALGRDQLPALLKLAASARAAAVGPGLGRAESTQDLVRALWQGLELPAVFDADALFALGQARPAPAAAPRVLTPHEGELKVLLGPRALEAGRPAAARRLASAYGALALLKGPATLAADPRGRLGVNTTGSAALASAGTGDVLAGALGALLAQGLDPFAAAGLAAWAHGRAGELWQQSRAGADRGLLASDLVEGLPAALALALQVPTPAQGSAASEVS